MVVLAASRRGCHALAFRRQPMLAVMPRKPEIVATRTIAESRLFTIEEVDLHFANGAEVCFEQLRSRGSGAVMVVPVTATGSVLLVREYGAGVDRYELQLPKGRIERDEPPGAAAERELREEVGYGAGRLEPITHLTLAPGYIGHITQVMLARALYAAPLTGDEPEAPEVIEWPLDDLAGLTERGDCSEARTLAALYIVRDRLDRQEQ
jgi:ADP-ribose diphosphatase